MIDTRKSGGRDRAGRFTTGNPGRPRGARHKATEAVQALLEGQVEALTLTAINAALGGDTVALRLCLERLAPARRDNPVAFPLPQLKTAQDAIGAAGAIVEAVADGTLTPSEAAHCMALVEGFRRIIETGDLEQRITALEART